MSKVELFDITLSKNDQREAEMALTPEQRLLLCLDLMELTASLAAIPPTIADDKIEWIELSLQHE